ncbi:hypothetical protein ACLMJK_008585 [Lecanora helva]
MPPGPKPGNTPRRTSSALSKVSTPPTTAAASTPARSAKSTKLSKVVHFKLPKDQLRQFPHEQHIKKASRAKASPLSTAKVITPDESVAPAIVKPEPDTTPAPNEDQDSAQPSKAGKSEGISASKAAKKKENGNAAEGDDKDKPKTNVKKRPRPDPNKPDGRTAAAKALKQASGMTTATHKLGPKANQGIINAGLRALDRTRTPCRKWGRKGLQLKSFTGQVWEVSSWGASGGRAFGSESEQDTSNNHSKEDSSSNVGEDRSPAINPSNQASSPVNSMATPA